MHTIETTGLVTPDHKLLIDGSVPAEIRPGAHKVTLMIDAAEPLQEHGAPFFRPPYPIGLTSESTFRREDIYDDAGR